MKALVLYRSYYGNTKKVAETIGQRLKEKGYDTVVQDVRQKLPDISQIDVFFNGAPTRLKHVNRKSLGILKKLKAKGIADKPLAIFDTCGVMPATPEEIEKAKDWIVPGAAGIMHRHATELGLNVHHETLRCEVREMKGPMADNAVPKAISFTDAFVAAMKK